VTRSLNSSEIVRSRCTDFAMEFLRELDGHRKLPALLDKLMEIDGLITRSDVERVYMDLVKLDG